MNEQKTAGSPARARRLMLTPDGNVLTDALRSDSHLGDFLSSPLPSKDNGFDVEGLAVYDDRIFLGLRGPVLRGWAVILELSVEDGDEGLLELVPVGDRGELYKKHFVDLDGLGVRDICFDGSDHLVLAGPTMALDGATRIYRFIDALGHGADSMTRQVAGGIERVMDIPWGRGEDRAEGVARTTFLDRAAAIVVYDGPAQMRRPTTGAVYADVFALPPRLGA